MMGTEPQPVLDLEGGKDLRAQGIEQVSSHNGDFLTIMRHTAKTLSERNGKVTTDDLRVAAAKVGLKPDHPNAWGGVFHYRGFRRIGYTQSSVRSNRGRVIAIWRWEGR